MLNYAPYMVQQAHACRNPIIRSLLRYLWLRSHRNVHIPTYTVHWMFNCFSPHSSQISLEADVLKFKMHVLSLSHTCRLTKRDPCPYRQTCTHFISKTSYQHRKSFHLFHINMQTWSLKDPCPFCWIGVRTHARCGGLEPATVNLSRCGGTWVAFLQQLEHTHVCMRAQALTRCRRATRSIHALRSWKSEYEFLKINPLSLSRSLNSFSRFCCFAVCFGEGMLKIKGVLPCTHQRVSVKFAWAAITPSPIFIYNKMEQKLVDLSL